jgi:uncharacterized membrane protein YhaH (DUF805 family)
MKWYSEVISKYVVFQGRARRKEYWMFVLFNYIFSIGLLLIDVYVFDDFLFDGYGIGILSMIYSLFVMLPSWAVAVRRLHDIGKSGWMMLVALIPIAGPIWLLILYATDSQPGENQYGPNPKEIASEAATQTY